MKNEKIGTTKKLNRLNKSMKEVLLNGKIMTHITDQNKSIGMWAKVTEILINNRFYYGMWEKDMFEDKWNLLNFGEQPEIEPMWNEYIDFWEKQGQITGKIAA